MNETTLHWSNHMKIDITKPIVDRYGNPAKIVASGLTGAIPLNKTISYLGGETLLVQMDSDELFYLYEDGRAHRDSHLPLVVNAPERTREFRTVTFRDDKIDFGGMRCATENQAQELTYTGRVWDGVLELVRIGDKIVDVKFHAAA